MKVNHHRLIGLNTLMVIDMIKKNGLPVPANINLDNILNIFRPRRKQQRVNRKRFRNYLGAPDLIMDVYIEMPFGMDDRYEFYGHGLSAFQHFITPETGNYRGYNWDHDDSLDGIEITGDVLMTVFSTDVKYDSTIDEYGFRPDIMVNSPMNLLIDDRGGNVDLDDFQFPTAAEVGGYYGDIIANDQNQPTRTRVRGAAFSLHFVMDACCAHHVTGYLMNGHSEWEAQLELNWRRRFDSPKDQSRLNNKFEIMAKEVSDYLMNNPKMAGLNSIRGVIEDNASFIDKWLKNNDNREMAMKGMINRYHTKEICTHAIASCVTSLGLMF